jgi:hypothetical protein
MQSITYFKLSVFLAAALVSLPIAQCQCTNDVVNTCSYTGLNSGCTAFALLDGGLAAGAMAVGFTFFAAAFFAPTERMRLRPGGGEILCIELYEC